jgi:hypothetical protein
MMLAATLAIAAAAREGTTVKVATFLAASLLELPWRGGALCAVPGAFRRSLAGSEAILTAQRAGTAAQSTP